MADFGPHFGPHFGPFLEGLREGRFWTPFWGWSWTALPAGPEKSGGFYLSRLGELLNTQQNVTFFRPRRAGRKKVTPDRPEWPIRANPGNPGFPHEKVRIWAQKPPFWPILGVSAPDPDFGLPGGISPENPEISRPRKSGKISPPRAPARDPGFWASREGPFWGSKKGHF